MKKLVLALVASTMIAGTASAAISTGFYVGGSIGYGNAKAKTATGLAGLVATDNNQLGNDAANIGIHGGYGMLSGCWYFGGELFYTFENMKISQTGTGLNPQVTELKRNGYYGLALRAGYVFMHNTMLYVRAGAHMGKWSLRSSVAGTANSSFTGSKNRLSFAPGVGIETALNKNLYLRGEWFYEFGPSIRTANSLAAVTSTTASNVRYNSFKLGLSYKF